MGMIFTDNIQFCFCGFLLLKKGIPKTKNSLPAYDVIHIINLEIANTGLASNTGLG